MRRGFGEDEFDEADFDEDEFDFDEDEYYLDKKAPHKNNSGKDDYGKHDFDKEYDRMIEYEMFGPLGINSSRFNSKVNNELKELPFWQKFVFYLVIGLLIYFLFFF